MRETHQNVNADRMIDRPVYGDMMHVIIMHLETGYLCLTHR